MNDALLSAHYFANPITGKWDNLGSDRGSAFAAYNRLKGPDRSLSTLKDVLTRYKTEVTPLPLRGRPRTKDALDNEIRTLERFDRLFGHMAQDELKQRHLYEYIDRRTDERKELRGQKKAAPSAARHDIRFLRKVLAKGIRWGAGETNSALNLDLDPDPKNTRDVTHEEYAAVYALANTRVQIAMALAANIAAPRGHPQDPRRAPHGGRDPGAPGQDWCRGAGDLDTGAARDDRSCARAATGYPQGVRAAASRR
jgi:hypothetical protein